MATAQLRCAADTSLLYAAEATYCAGFAQKRVADFTAGRLCARRALEDLGITDFPIEINADRSPRWPPDIVGSISHASGFCCAAVADGRVARSIGVDVELVGRISSELDALVFTARESAFLSSLADEDRARAATIIFSAKEAFYKCQYVITHRWLDFQDASLELTTADMRSGAFVVTIADSTPALDGSIALPLRGRFSIDGDLAITGIMLR